LSTQATKPKKKAKPSKVSTKPTKKLTPRGKTFRITPQQAQSVRDHLQTFMEAQGIKAQVKLAERLDIRYPRVNNLILTRATTLSETEADKITKALGTSRDVLLGSAASLPAPQEVVDLSRLANDGTQEDEEEEVIQVELAVGKIRLRIEARA
jgi:plasmid maintenance system antidote protein VapI